MTNVCVCTRARVGVRVWCHRSYVLPRRSPEAAALGYTVALPFSLKTRGETVVLRLYVGEQPASHHAVHLILKVKNAVAADTLSLRLNDHLDLMTEPTDIQPRNGNRGREQVSGTYDGLRISIGTMSDSHLVLLPLIHL